ncbi:MAG: hypothetical protein MRZ79_22870 [Bacteroidia bacterium]|nr:hypothetical protein [Bacteroidia bacterium]
MKTFLLVLLIFIPAASLKAQNFELPKFQISLSYFGEMATHGGIRIGLTTPISQMIKEKGEETSVNKAWIVGGCITYYKHPRNHKGLMVTGVIGRQRVGKNGFQTSLNLEAGYMLSILDGETYEWNDSEIVESSNKGSSHIVFGLNGGFGWNFDKKTDLPLSFMIQPHLYFQAPYNTTIVPRLALETKLSYNLK